MLVTVPVDASCVTHLKSDLEGPPWKNLVAWILSSHTSSMAPITSLPLLGQLMRLIDIKADLPLPSLRHVPGDVPHPVLFRQKLIEVADTLPVFRQ